MSRGVIMSKKGRRAVVLTKDGAFKKVKLRKSADVAVGQEIFSHHLSQPPAHHRQRWLIMAAASLSLIFLFVLSGGAEIPSASAAAYVSFDIQPSVEASVDRHLNIIKVRALNKSASRLLGEPKKYEHMSLKAFTSKLADDMSKKGYLSGNPELVITTTIPDSVKPDSKTAILTSISKAISPLKQKKVFVQGKGKIKTLTATEKKHKKAVSEGLSTGKYLIFKQTAKSHPDLTITKAKTLTVKQIDHFESDVTKSHSTAKETLHAHAPKKTIAKPKPTKEPSHYNIPNHSRPVVQSHRKPVPKRAFHTEKTSDHHQWKEPPKWGKRKDLSHHPKVSHQNGPHPKKGGWQHHKPSPPFLKSPYPKQEPSKSHNNNNRDNKVKYHSHDPRMNHGPQKTDKKHH